MEYNCIGHKHFSYEQKISTNCIFINTLLLACNTFTSQCTSNSFISGNTHNLLSYYKLIKLPVIQHSWCSFIWIRLDSLYTTGWCYFTDIEYGFPNFENPCKRWVGSKGMKYSGFWSPVSCTVYNLWLQPKMCKFICSSIKCYTSCSSWLNKLVHGNQSNNVTSHMLNNDFTGGHIRRQITDEEYIKVQTWSLWFDIILLWQKMCLLTL